MLSLLIYILIGLVGGVASGFFGIGGGLVMVPLMVFALDFTQKKAQGTSLALFLFPVGFLAVREYVRAGNVDWRAAALLAVGFVGGAYFGGRYANLLPTYVLKRSFGVFIIFVGVKMIWDSYRTGKS